MKNYMQSQIARRQDLNDLFVKNMPINTPGRMILNHLSCPINLLLCSVLKALKLLRLEVHRVRRSQHQFTVNPVTGNYKQ